jgi:hypothetical protein
MRTRQLCKDKLEEEMIEHKHLLPNHNERLKELTLTRHKNTSPLYATVPKTEYDALKKKLDICQKECIRIAELYKRTGNFLKQRWNEWSSESKKQ